MLVGEITIDFEFLVVKTDESVKNRLTEHDIVY